MNNPIKLGLNPGLLCLIVMLAGPIPPALACTNPVTSIQDQASQPTPASQVPTTYLDDLPLGHKRGRPHRRIGGGSRYIE
jgi:hypothetical protein